MGGVEYAAPGNQLGDQNIIFAGMDDRLGPANKIERAAGCRLPAVGAS
jgi:hypothetical protein